MVLYAFYGLLFNSVWKRYFYFYLTKNYCYKVFLGDKILIFNTLEALLRLWNQMTVKYDQNDDISKMIYAQNDKCKKKFKKLFCVNNLKSFQY